MKRRRVETCKSVTSAMGLIDICDHAHLVQYMPAIVFVCSCSYLEYGLFCISLAFVV